MTFPTFTMRQLLEAGVHFGHTTRRWNPKMAPYIFGARNGVHIIDLEQTVPMLHQSLNFVRDVVAGGGRVLFVGTKRQASEKIAESAKKCGQYYVNHRWLGGMLTNWKTISHSIKRLKELDEQLSDENVEETSGLTKKELLNLTRERDKLERALGGIKDMGDLPNILVVVDTNREHIAVAEANKLEIPVIAIIDSNSDPEGITFPIPGNDDAFRAISTYCNLMADAVLDGIQQELISSGADVGEAEEAPAEDLPEDSAEAATAEKAKEKKPDSAKEAKAEKAKEKKPDSAEEAAAEEAQEKSPEASGEAAAEEDAAAATSASDETKGQSGDDAAGESEQDAAAEADAQAKAAEDAAPDSAPAADEGKDSEKKAS